MGDYFRNNSTKWIVPLVCRFSIRSTSPPFQWYLHTPVNWQPFSSTLLGPGLLRLVTKAQLFEFSMLPMELGFMSCEGIKYIPEKTSFACGKLTEMTETYIFVFFRGLKRTATIYSLSFSPCGLYLACSSNTETIHVFKMDETSPKDM